MIAHTISKGVMVAFDIFSKKEQGAINKKISEAIGVKPSNQKSAFFGGSSETDNFIWTPTSLEPIFTLFKTICEKNGFSYDNKFVQKFVEKVQVWGYNSPSLPYFILIVRIQLKKDTLNSAKDLRVDLINVSMGARLFIESLKGYHKALSTFKPSSPLITQLWIKTSKKEHQKMRALGIKLLEQKEKLNLTEKREIGKKIRSLEPTNLSAKVGDIHSIIPSFSNVTFVVGHMTQIALGGLMTPFIEYLSYDDKLLEQDYEMYMKPAELLIGGGIWNVDYTRLIGIISLWIYLIHLNVRREKNDESVSKLRNILSSEATSDKIEKYFMSLNELGTHASSLQQTIGRFSRRWGGVLHQIAEGKNDWTLEIPIENIDTFGITHVEKGYFGTISSNILLTLKNTTKFLESQTNEISSLRTHISDMVNLRIIRTNEKLSHYMKTLAQMAIIIALFSLGISVANWIFYIL